MSDYWETKSGQLIKFEYLTDSHLENILKYIEKKAEEGEFCGCYDSFGNDHYADFIEGDEIKDKYNYIGLLEEVRRRWLLNIK